jgi:hypothetical protein
VAKPWIKLWHDLLADTTIQRWTPAQRHCWAGVLLIASQAKVEGQITDAGGEELTVADLSSQLNVDWHTANRFLDRAQAAGKIARNADGVLYVVNYAKRQRSPVSAIVDRSLRTGRSSETPRTIVGSPPTPTRTRAQGKTQERDEEAPQLDNATRDPARPLPIEFDQVEAACRQLRGFNDRTPRAVASVLAGMSEAEWVAALERTRRRRPENEAAYLVGTLKRMRGDRAA